MQMSHHNLNVAGQHKKALHSKSTRTISLDHTVHWHNPFPVFQIQQSTFQQGMLQQNPTAELGP